MSIPQRFTFARTLKGLSSVVAPRFKILAYHSIDEVNHDIFTVTPSAFKRQMLFLVEEGFQVISLEEALSDKKAGTIRNKSIVVTFDDGYEALWHFAFPVLKKLELCATVFLPVQYIGGVDVFSYDKPRPQVRLLNWDMISESTRSGISYGSHTMTHRNLIPLGGDALHYELNESKTVLKSRLNLSFSALAYPFGMFDERVKRAAHETGYDCALGFGNVLSNTKATDPFEMKREKIVNTLSLEEFGDIVNVRNDLRRKTRELTKRLGGWDRNSSATKLW